MDGSYESQNPEWHEEDAVWKADVALSMMAKNGIVAGTVCDVGCGTGGVLRALALKDGFRDKAVGFDVSNRIIDMAESYQTPEVTYRVWSDSGQRETFDLALIMDVVEHVPDYLGFLSDLHGLADRYILHIPLDMNSQGIARGTPIIRARELLGHLHYFSRETALASLEYAGFEIVDWQFTPSGSQTVGKSLGRRIFDVIRLGLFRQWPERSVDILGGYSLLILARGKE